MTRSTNSESPSARFRIGLKVDASFHRHLQLAAAVHDQTVVQYVLEAVNDRLRQENNDGTGTDVILAAADPVLAELWDNPKDAEYDRPKLSDPSFLDPL